PTCYSPVRHSSFNKPEGLKKEAFDLHVLGTPPAFVLSQDQTLIIKGCIDHTPDRFCSNKIDFASFCLHVFASRIEARYTLVVCLLCSVFKGFLCRYSNFYILPVSKIFVKKKF